VVKKDIVNYAATHWFKEFSRMFDGFVASGPNLPKIAVRLAFNSQGLLVFSSENRDASQLLSLSYSQIKKASSLRYVDRFHPWIVVISFTLPKKSSRRLSPRPPSLPSFCFHHPTPLTLGMIATLCYLTFLVFLPSMEVLLYYKPLSISSLLSRRTKSSYPEHQVQKFIIRKWVIVYLHDRKAHYICSSFPCWPACTRSFFKRKTLKTERV